MNNENLDVIRDTATAKEKGSKGGKVTAQRRRMKKKVSALLLDLLARKAKPCGVLEELQAKGFDIDADTTNAAAVAYSLFCKSIGGDVQATRLLLELAGEDPQLEHKKQIDRAALKLKEKALDVAADNDKEIRINIVPHRRPLDEDDSSGDE